MTAKGKVLATVSFMLILFAFAGVAAAVYLALQVQYNAMTIVIIAAFIAFIAAWAALVEAK